jgi:hypothetical protein
VVAQEAPMLRASNFGGHGDTLVRIIRQTCYSDKAIEIAALFRKMLQTYHSNDTESYEEINELDETVFDAIPTAVKVNMVGLYPVYHMAVRDTQYRCTWREMLAKGSYNQVYYADLTIIHSKDKRKENDSTTTRAVVKVSVETEDFRVYLLENVLHAILYEHPVTRDIVVPMHFPFKIRNSGFPRYILGTVLENPGRDHLGYFIEHYLQSDDQMFSILTQLAFMLYRVQSKLRMEHRDLKADNVMLLKQTKETERVQIPNSRISFEYPMFDVKLGLIDFGMTRIELDGEYLACDVMHTNTNFNTSHDLQHFCCTLVEDYSEELKDRAPAFYDRMRLLTAPIFETLTQKHKKYAEGSSSYRHRKLCQYVSVEQNPLFTPSSFLDVLQRHWVPSRKRK